MKPATLGATPMQRRFLKTLDSPEPNPERVALAREVVRRKLLCQGVDLEEHLESMVEELVGAQEHLTAAFALGIAVGQLFHPDVFDVRVKGGAR